MRPLLAWPALSASARSLTDDDKDVQLTLALDAYEALEGLRTERKAGKQLKWHVARMWRGHEGALLFWCGELARQMPYDRPLARRWQKVWGRAYSRSEMAVGPLPWWLGDTAFHLACQAQLIAQDVRYAGQFVHAPLEMVYRWPTERVGEWVLATS